MSFFTDGSRLGGKVGASLNVVVKALRRRAQTESTFKLVVPTDSVESLPLTRLLVHWEVVNNLHFRQKSSEVSFIDLTVKSHFYQLLLLVKCFSLIVLWNTCKISTEKLLTMYMVKAVTIIRKYQYFKIIQII